MGGSAHGDEGCSGMDGFNLECRIRLSRDLQRPGLQSFHAA